MDHGRRECQLDRLLKTLERLLLSLTRATSQGQGAVMHFFEQVYVVVRWIPRGRVASYGQIARLLGQPHAARTVGWALQGLTKDDVPWHRVVNAAGRISIPDQEGARWQRRRLEAEGVEFDSHGRIDMKRFGWRGLSRVEVERLLAGRDPDEED